MHATLANLHPQAHAFWDTPGASTSTHALRASTTGSQPSRPNSAFSRSSIIDPHIRMGEALTASLYHQPFVDNSHSPFPNSNNQMASPPVQRYTAQRDLPTPTHSHSASFSYSPPPVASAQSPTSYYNNYYAPNSPPAQPAGATTSANPDQQLAPLSAPAQQQQQQPSASGATQSQSQSQPQQARSSPPLHSHAGKSHPYPTVRRDGRRSPKPESYYAPNAALLYSHAQVLPSSASASAAMGGSAGQSASAAGAFAPSPIGGIPCRLPPILQVEKQQVTTTATQAASASRRRNEAHFICPVPGCGSTFTRRFNLRGHLRSHTEERPYRCEYPGCNKGFARQHDCKRHQALHQSKSTNNTCSGCGKTFSRLDALNRHLRSEGGSECRQVADAQGQLQPQPQPQPQPTTGIASSSPTNNNGNSDSNSNNVTTMAASPADDKNAFASRHSSITPTEASASSGMSMGSTGEVGRSPDEMR